MTQDTRPSASITALWEKIDKTGSCWNWTGYCTKLGYGIHQVGWGKSRVRFRAHRLVYELLIGPIPDGLVLDHLCYNTSCVNPSHLEPVTNGENVRRAMARITHCPHGHEYTPENTYSEPNRNSRRCRECHRQESNARYRRARSTT